MKSLQPLLKWPGGKARMAKRLSRMLPTHRTFVEPFAGGAAVFFHKPLVGVNVIGDYDGWVASFYDQVRKGGLRQCRSGIRKSKPLFDRSKRGSSACMKVAQTCLSFHGDRSTYVGEGATAKRGHVMHKGKLKRFKDYEKKLRRSHIFQGDFAAVMRKFDGPDTLHFLDPPWPLEYSDVLYKGGKKARVKGNKGKGLKGRGTAFDPAHVKKVCKSMQGAVLMIINDSPALRRMYCSDPSFRCKSLKVATNTGRGMVMKKNLIIQKPARRGGVSKGASAQTPEGRANAPQVTEMVTMKVLGPVERMRVR